MARTRKNKKNEISKIKVTRIRNLIIASVIAICLIIIYKFNFMTKSEITDIIRISFLEIDGEDTKSMDLEIFEDETGKDYIILPEKINGYYTSKFFVDTVKEIEETKIENSSKSENPLTFIPSQNILVQNNTIDNQNVIDSNSNTNTNTSSSNTITKQDANTFNTQIENTKKELTENNIDVNKISTTNRSTKKNIAISEIKATRGIVKESATSNFNNFKNETEIINKEMKENENDVSNISNIINENSNNNEIVNNVNGEEHSEDNENTSDYINESNENVNINDNQIDGVEEDNNEEVKTENNPNKLSLPAINNEPIKIDITSSVPGERFYLPEEFKLYDENSETKSYKKISIKVEFQTKEIKGVKLYNQELLANLQNSILKLNGYIPKDYVLDIIEIGKKKIEEYMSDEEEFEGSEVLVSYDIKIKNGEKEYQPEDYYQNVNVAVTSAIEFEGKINKQSIEVIHIKETDEEIVLEKVNIASKTEDTVEFITNEFSEYAIIAYSSVTPSTVRIEDYASDYNYYMGRNYTDNMSGINKGKYTDDSLANVTINYYSYNPDATQADITLVGNAGSMTTALTQNRYDYFTNTYTYTCTSTISISGDNYIDKNSNWKMTFNNLPNSITFDVGATQTANTDLEITVSNDNIITITGNNWRKGWTNNSNLPRYENSSFNQDSIIIKFVFTTNTNYNGNNTLFNSTTVRVTTKEQPKIGYVSADNNERQTLFTYSKCIPIDENGNVNIELIDNPYMDRPAGYGFNGWLLRTGFNGTISTDSDTYEQTLRVNTNGLKELTIDLYVDWTKANVIFLNSSSGNDTSWGGNIESNALRTWGNANGVKSHLDSNKTSNTASAREFNIIVITGRGTPDNILSNYNQTYRVLNTNIPCTITSLYNGIDYRNSGANLNFGYDFSINCDIQLDYLNLTNSQNYTNTNTTGTFSRFIIGNNHNLRIGRGMVPIDSNNTTTTFAQVQGGRYDASNNASSYKIVIESGKYANIHSGTTSGTGWTGDSIMVLGNDFDRANNNNELLKNYYRLASRAGAGNNKSKSGKFTFKIVVKSGSFGMDYFTTQNDENRAYAGIYVGGHSSGNDENDRILLVEGGRIANIIGGLAIQQASASTVKTYMYVKGGTIQNIVGGAGVSTTYGDRIIQVTDGSVAYSVSGGSNGYKAGSSSSANPTGEMKGKSLVYIGGNAKIGTVDSSNQLYDVSAGCVLGAGNGCESKKDTSGKVASTQVIIDGNAEIGNSVFGGGNFGRVEGNTAVITLQNATSFSSNTNYLITDSGTGGNGLTANGANITTSSIRTESIPSNASEWIFESAGSNQYYIKNVATGNYLCFGEFENVRYDSVSLSYANNGNYNAYLNSNYYLDSKGEELIKSITCTTSGNYWNTTYNWVVNGKNFPITANWGQSANLTIYKKNTTTGIGYNLSSTEKTVFNISAYNNGYLISNNSNGTTYYLKINNGSLNANTSSQSGTRFYFLTYTLADSLVKIDILGGTIKNNVYGGANQNDIGGSVKINMTGGNVEGTIYGGSNSSGNIQGNASISIQGGTIDLNDTQDSVFGGGHGKSTTINGATILNIVDSNNNVYISGNIYGGSELGTVTGNAMVTVHDTYSTSNNILISGNIYGGGKGNNTESAINTGDCSVVIDGGSYSTAKAFGGCNINGKIGGKIEVKVGENYNTYINEVYGGGNQAAIVNDTDRVNVYLYKNATVDRAFNGGNQAGINPNNANTPRQIYAQGAKVTEGLYGGSNTSGTLTETFVQVSEDAVIENVYGGGKGQNTNVTTKTTVDIDNSTINYEIYGGGDEGKVAGETFVYIDNSTTSNIYGGGKGQTATVGKDTLLTILNSNIVKTIDETGNIFGGGNAGEVAGNTTTTLDHTNVQSTLYGGGNKADVLENTSVLVENSILENIYGGGNAGSICGTGKVGADGIISSTAVTLISSTVNNNVFGGGNEGEVTGNTVVSADGAIINNSVYGGGKSAKVNGTRVAFVGATEAQYVYGGGDQGEVADSTTIIIKGSKVRQNVYGGGNGAELANDSSPGKVAGNTDITISNNSEIDNQIFGAGRGTTAVVIGNTNLKINNSTVKSDIYGGGDNGPVNGSTEVKVSSSNIGGNTFAAGNGATAVTTGNSHIAVEGNCLIGKNIFGGGNNAQTGNINSVSIVDIAGATINHGVYGGGNLADIKGSTVVNIGNKAINDYYISIGQTAKNYEIQKISIGDTIYGGSESKEEGGIFNYDHISVYGTILINIDGTGYDESTDVTLNFYGSIFGSGNASRANQDGNINIKNYGESDNPKRGISIQRANTVVIDNSSLVLNGTTDSTSLHPNAYYTFNIIQQLNIKNNSVLYLRNSTNLLKNYASLVGEDGSEEIATVKIIDKAYDINGTEYEVINGNIYKANGDLQYYIKDGVIYKPSSNPKNPDIEISKIDEEKTQKAVRIEKNVDNRIYMYSGINFYISGDQELQSEYGNVEGMTFLGMYKSENEVNLSDADETEIYTGIYSPNYTVGGNIEWKDRDYNRCYVLGKHNMEGKNDVHDIAKDGFYTVFEELDSSLDEITMDITEEVYKATSYISYIMPTPELESYYMWYVGPDNEIYYYTQMLTASKHSSFATKEIPLLGISLPNAKVTVKDVSPEFIEGVTLVNKNSIPTINDNQEAANNEFALSMQNGNNAWSVSGTTDYYMKEGITPRGFDGTTEYVIENSTSTPSFSFYLYHSNNITEERELGYYRVTMDVTYWKDSLNLAHAKIIIDLALRTEMDNFIGYNGTITPGAQYDMFTTTPTNVTTKSSFSVFFEFAESEFSQNELVQKYFENSYRVITTDSFVFPENTTITMIDKHNKSNPRYYYYLVTAEDEASKKVEFALKDFKAMGSVDEYYDEALAQQEYYNENLDFEYENFIFIVNFAESKFGDLTNVKEVTKNQRFRIFLKSDEKAEDDRISGANMSKDEIGVIFKLLSDQIEEIVYGIYNSDSLIKINTTLNKNRIYLGSNLDMKVDINFDVQILDTIRVFDTKYFDQKSGIKISFYKQNNNGEYEVVNGSDLLGIYFEIGDKRYFPRADGTTRIKIAELVSNSTSNIRIVTKNSSLPTGSYQIVIESFGSADGIYYGLDSSDSTTVNMRIINDIYGIVSNIPSEQSIIDKETGNTLDVETGYVSEEKNNISVKLKYLSGINNPYITVSLERRDYNPAKPYDDNYIKVNLQDYVNESLSLPVEINQSYSEEDDDFVKSIIKFKDEYTAVDTSTIKRVVIDDTVEVDFTLNYSMKEKLKSGTYKLVFKLYDANEDIAQKLITDDKGNVTAKNFNITDYEYIGETFSYMIIK